jgi:hypothetical protein
MGYIHVATGKNRSTGVTVLAILEILGGLGALSLDYMIVAISAMMAGIVGGFSIGFLGAIVGAIGGLIGGIVLLIGIVDFVIAYAFLTGRGWLGF